MGGGEFVKTEDAAASQVTLDVKPEYSQVSGLSSHELMVMARLQVPQEMDDDRRAPVNICAVIDRSESMKTHISLVRETLSFMVQQLRPEDSLSLVTFDNQVKTELPLQAMTVTGKEHAQAAIRRLKERGQTNLSGGLLSGLQQLMMAKQEEGRKARIESVLLFTDGRANIGIRDTPTITKATSSVIKQIGRNVCVFTFGFGSEHDAAMLRSIADAGNGLYYYISDVDSIPDSFCDCLGGLLSVAAQNLCLEIAALGNQTIAKPLTSYQIATVEPNKKFSVTIPDIYSEEEKDILFKVTVPANKSDERTEPWPLELAQCVLQYFDVVTCQVETLQATAIVRVCPGEDLTTVQRPGMQDEDVALQRFRLQTAQALAEAQQLAEENHLERARSVLKRCVQQTESSSVAGHELARHLVETCTTSVDALQDRVAYVSEGRARMTNHIHSHLQQRSNLSPVGKFSPARKAMSATAACALPPPVESDRLKEFSNPYRGKKKAKLMVKFQKASTKPSGEEE